MQSLHLLPSGLTSEKETMGMLWISAWKIGRAVLLKSLFVCLFYLLISTSCILWQIDYSNLYISELLQPYLFCVFWSYFPPGSPTKKWLWLWSLCSFLHGALHWRGPWKAEKERFSNGTVFDFGKWMLKILSSYG